MSLIDSTYFVLDVNIPSSNYSDLTASITRYEKEALTMLLGYELYTALVADLDGNGDPQTQRFIDLVEGKEYSEGDETMKWNGFVNTDLISLVAYYVYYKWLKNHLTNTTVSGVMGNVSENAVMVSPSQKVSQVYRSFKELYGYPGQNVLIPSAYNFLMKYESTYPEWVYTHPGSVNSFDL